MGFNFLKLKWALKKGSLANGPTAKLIIKIKTQMIRIPQAMTVMFTYPLVWQVVLRHR